MGIDIKEKFMVLSKKIHDYIKIIKNYWNQYTDKQKNIILGLGLGIFAICIWLLYGLFSFPLTSDMGLYFYGGKELLQGNVPYVTIFDVKPPMTFFVSAAGLSFSYIFNLDPVVLGPRILFLLFGSGTVFFTYLLTYHLFKDRLIAILSAIILISFTGFGWASLSGRPQIIMIFFAIACLYYSLIRKKWFIAGIFGTLSALTWQPGAIFPIIVIIYSFIDKKDRKHNLIRSVFGAALPLLVVIIFFLIMGGLNEMFNQTVLFIFSFKSSGHWGFFQSIGTAILNLIDVYGTEILFFIAGFLGFILFAYKKRKNLLNFKSPIPFIVFSFIPLFIYTCFDFQWWPDFIHLLPYIALFASFFIFKISKKIGNFIRQRTKLKNKKTATFIVIFIIILSSLYGICPKFFEHEAVMVNIRKEIFDKGDYERITQMESDGDIFGVVSILIEDIGFFRLLKMLFLTTKSFDINLQEQTEIAKYIESNSNSSQRLLFIGTPNLLFLSNREIFNKYVLYPADIIYMQLNDEISSFREMVIDEKPPLIITNNWSQIFYTAFNIPNIPPELELNDFINENYEMVRQSKHFDIFARK